LIGYVPQVPALYRALTVNAHLRLAAAERSSFDVRMANTYLDVLGVPMSAKGAELSGGQRAQVSLALALGTGAPILLLDEPLASLDPLARRDFLGVLTAAVSDTKVIAVLSSHVVSDIEESCDRIILLGEGAVILDASIADLLASHAVSTGEIALPADWQFVTEYAGRSQQRARLWRRTRVDDTLGMDLRPATLEDVVIGYLSTARTRAH
jgi:ABC-2 type transport system ATP-binding protein